MQNERKMASVFWAGSFAEAEIKDDTFWAAASVEQRLNELYELRQIFFRDEAGKFPDRIAATFQLAPLGKEDD